MQPEDRMIKPTDFNSVDETIEGVNLKKLEEMAEDDPTLEEKLEAARKALRATREFHEGGPRRLYDLDLPDTSTQGDYYQYGLPESLRITKDELEAMEDYE